ncbi:transcriptional regulator [Clostridia bacterium]|nr:transcriptional regulator [Clostridia bacterium]
MAEAIHFTETKHLNLSIAHPNELQAVMHALGSALRLDILRVLGTRSMSVREIAKALELPVSTISLNVSILEAADLLLIDQQAAAHGVMKLCSRKLDSLAINLLPQQRPRESVYTFTLPIGAYSLAEDITPTCGLASVEGSIGEEDNPRTFYLPLIDRLNAQLLWFRRGYVTYYFTILRVQEIRVRWIEISFEVCSEAPSYHDPWKSDIDLSINGISIGTYTSPADFGGRRGLLNPSWWSDLSTQFGKLTTWRVTEQASYMDGAQVSDVTVSQLNLDTLPYIAVRIGVSPNAENVGGMNLFGEHFGDFPQAIILHVGYDMR